MPLTLSELLAQASDDLEISIGDSKIKASELKAFRTATDTERRQYETKHQEAERLAQEAKQVYDGLKTAQAEFDKRNAPPPDTSKDGWRKNPLYEDLIPVIDAANAAAAESRALANSTKGEYDKMSAIYALERMRREWAETTTKPKDKKFEEVVAEALQAKEVDAMGLPTISRALNRLTEPDRMEAYAAQKVADAQKEWEKKQRINEVAKPGKFAVKGKGNEPPIKNLNDLTSELVANDPDIQAAMLDGSTH